MVDGHVVYIFQVEFLSGETYRNRSNSRYCIALWVTLRILPQVSGLLVYLIEASSRFSDIVRGLSLPLQLPLEPRF
jgi:hypothetical protein